MNRVQVLLSKQPVTAGFMRYLAYLKNDVFGEKIEDILIKKMPKQWQKMSILDVGSGPCRKQKDSRFKNKDITCFDIFAPYLSVCKRMGFKTVLGDVTKIHDFFDDKSFDIIWLIDVIEHLKKNDGRILLKNLDVLARKTIIISTPLGWYPQDFECVDGNWAEDITMVHSPKNSYQQHLSAWYEKDFKSAGFYCEVLKNYHFDIRSVSKELRAKPQPVSASQIWAVKTFEPNDS